VIKYFVIYHESQGEGDKATPVEKYFYIATLTTK